MPVTGLLTIHFQIEISRSLKEKRGIVRPLLVRLHKEFNVSTAEVDKLDSWNESVVCCAMVSNDNTYNQRMLQTVLEFITHMRPDLEILSYRIENQ